MSETRPNPPANPPFKYGMGVASAAIVVGVALFPVEDRTFRLLVFGIAALDLLVTPWVLGQATEQAEGGADAHEL